MLSPHPKANPLSSDVQVDMDDRGHGFRLVDPNGAALLCNPSGEGMQSRSQAVQCKSDKMEANHRRRPSGMVSST